MEEGALHEAEQVMTDPFSAESAVKGEVVREDVLPTQEEEKGLTDGGGGLKVGVGLNVRGGL